MVTLGDSITFANLWQPEIVMKIGVTYIAEETTTGTDGHKAMGISSSRIIPLINNSYVGQQSGNSIYERADDVDFYSPNLILLLGGQNDIGISTIGEVTDAAYTGGAVSSNPPTFCAAYSGTLLKLVTQNPTAKIVCLTPLYANDSAENYALKLPFINAIKTIAGKYSCEVVDLLNDLGVNSINYTSYTSDGIHPNALGAIRMAALISSRF